MSSNNAIVSRSNPTAAEYSYSMKSPSSQGDEEEYTESTPRSMQTRRNIIRPSPAQSDFTPIGRSTRKSVVTSYRLCESIDQVKYHIQCQLSEHLTQNDRDEFWARYLYCTYVDQEGNKLSFFCFVFFIAHWVNYSLG
ncbi:hypothetical protein FBUS_04480 [Fasciolopsis buskii]|uniref:Uncharacterized protein n=1 Tax=Fasciolopsis buskii TaxID=27845 RepID=A0A8E0S7B7_9TREM|nr:hypothetical protein FBUS_04480 [Fasciolopsis buski]